MGKAAVDLPDPLQTPSDPNRARTLTSTDDLLAKLAGEEIDRLLAEVEEAAPAPAAFAPLPASASAAPPTIVLDDTAAADALAPVVPTFVEKPAPPPELSRDTADLNAELDAIFGAAAAPSPPAAPRLFEAGAPARVLEGDLAETSAAERAGLNAPAATAAAPRAALPATVSTAPRSAAPEPAAGPLPLYLRPLEWINAPLESCPQPVRDFVGKAAIITLANAAAILLYVLLFRRG